MSNNSVHPMVLKAARAWCKRHAEACGLDDATLWAEREAGFVTEAQAALEECGLLEFERDALRYRWLRDEPTLGYGIAILFPAKGLKEEVLYGGLVDVLIDEGMAAAERLP